MVVEKMVFELLRRIWEHIDTKPSKIKMPPPKKGEQKSGFIELIPVMDLDSDDDQ